MSMSPRIREYLDNQGIPYQLVHHDYSETARGCAEAAHIPLSRMVKAVVLRDDEGFIMALVPADKSVDINAINLRTNRLLSTATQKDVNLIFRDCTKGAVPGIGQAYNLRIIWDDRILEEPDCYLEAGDHEGLIYLARKEMSALVEDREHGLICH